MNFTERMMERNRTRYGKSESKESSQASFPLKEVHHNTVTTIASTSVDIEKPCTGANKVTIETTVTMRKVPKRSSNSRSENVPNEDDTSTTECESESTEEKENETSQDCPLRKDTKSKLQRLGVLYSDNPSRLSSPIHRTEERFLAEQEKEMPVKKSAARSARLAALADTINHWEDDVRHPPVGQETKGFARSESGQRLLYDYNKGEELCECNTKFGSPVERSPVKPISPVKERLADKEMSPAKIHSPVKTKSPVVSPMKGRYGSPIQMGVRGKVSTVRTSSSSEEDSVVTPPNMGLRLRRSPRKGPSSPGSVLNQIQKYENSASPTKRALDPAELPLSQRMALFERNSAPVLPKAPFAMPVPIKKLHSNSNLGPKMSTSRGPTTAGSSSSLNDRLAVFESGEKKFHTKNIPCEIQKELDSIKSRWDRNTNNGVEKHYFEPSAPPMSPVPPPPPLPSPPQPFDYDKESQHSRYFDAELAVIEEEPEKAYPVLKDVKRVRVSPPKPGCIYPCLSDMEIESEVQESEVEETFQNRSRMSETSQESDVSSLGKNITKISRSSLKRDWSDQSTTEETNEIDDFLDEAFETSSSADVTPPKRISYSNNAGSVQSSSFEFSNDRPECTDTNHPLLHTVSFYRRQQNMTQKPSSPTRVVHVESSSYSTDDSIERMEEELDRELRLVQKKIDLLNEEVKRQQTIISQASQALNLCYSTIEFSGSTEQLEAEKLLLLATQRRQAALHEIQRLKVEQTVRPQGPANKTFTERGSLTLSHITVPLKMDVIQHACKDDHCYYVLCLVHSDERVLSTEMMCAPRNLHSHNKLTFPNSLTLDDLYSDFRVTVEVYTMTARSKELVPHDIKYHINTNKKDAGKLRLTPRKGKVGKGDSKLMMPTVQSPGGPMAVRTSAFAMAGYVIFSLREVQRTQFTLNKNAYTSVLEGSMQLKIESEMSVDIEYRGFLTMFEDVSGFGAWHRRWCLLRGDKLSYWRYPDDESKKIPLDTIELSACTTKKVDAVARDVCARANTFLLEISRAAHSTDVDSLVLVRNGHVTTIRHLLSADTKEERILWCQHLNKALALIRAWGVK